MGTRIPARLSPAHEGRKFGLQVGPALLIFGGVAYWRGKHTTAVVLWSLGGGLIVLGLVAPALLGPVNQAWMALSRAIAKVTQPIFLGIVYFLAFVPVGLVIRLVGRNPMRRRARENTFWTSRAAGTRRGEMQQQF